MSLTIARTGFFDPMVVSWVGTAIAVSYAAYLTYTTAKDKRTGGGSASVGGGGGESSIINHNIKKDEPKVVDSFDMEDMGNKSVFCRCWKSKKFPYCDGAHAKHNKECGDNIGPLIVQKRDAQPAQG